MRYGLVVCPNCSSVRIVDLRHKKSKCPLCGKVYSLHELRIFKSSQNIQELSMYRAVLSAKLEGRDRDYILGLLKEMEKTEKEKAEFFSEKEAVLSALNEIKEKYSEKEGFTFEEFSSFLKKKRAHVNSEKWIEILQREGFIYKGRDGRFRVV